MAKSHPSGGDGAFHRPVGDRSRSQGSQSGFARAAAEVGGRSFARLDALAATAFAMALTACGVAKPPTPPPRAPEVGVARLSGETIAVRLELPGRTSAFEASEVRPQVTGLIRARLFEEGGSVRAGETLYEIDDASYRAATAQAAAALNSAQAARKSSCLHADRLRELLERRFVAPQAADDAAAACEQAAAAVSQAEAALSAARISLERTRVTAPISGRIGRSAVTQGALVTANQAASLAVIQRLDPVYVDITRSAVEMLRFRTSFSRSASPGSTASVRLKLPDGSDYETGGTLKFAESSVDPQTGSVLLRAVFPNPKGVLLPGMYVRAVLQEPARVASILVPKAQVTYGPQGEATVLVVRPDDRVERRPIKTGEAVGDRWVVTSGLAPGDCVIIDGSLKVKPGMRVRPVPIAYRAAALPAAVLGKAPG